MQIILLHSAQVEASRDIVGGVRGIFRQSARESEGS